MESLQRTMAAAAPHASLLPAWLQALYPFTPQSTITPAGARMSYLDEGPREQRAVLMLHGNPTWSFYYRDLARRVAKGQRVIVPDHVGMGLSDKPQDYDYRLSRRIGDVEALITALGLTKVDLVVHDWGGAIGFGLATRRPDLIGRIVILNTAAFVSMRIPFRISLCRNRLFGEALVRGLNGFAGPATRMTTVRPLSRDQRRGYLFPYDSWAHRVAVHRFVKDIPLEAGHPSRTELAGIEARLPVLKHCPKLLVWGGRDFCFNDHFLEQWRRIYPDAAVRRYADAGHYVLEDGGDDLHRLIDEFLKGDVGSS